MITINFDSGLIKIDLESIETGIQPCFQWQDFTLFLNSTGYPENNRESFSYLFYQGDTLLFSGSDFETYRKQYNVSHIMDLLTFLTVQPGDTDQEFFDNYSETQLNWASSQDCEDLKMLVYDIENLIMGGK